MKKEFYTDRTLLFGVLGRSVYTQPWSAKIQFYELRTGMREKIFTAYQREVWAAETSGGYIILTINIWRSKMNKQKMMKCTSAISILGMLLILLSCVQKQPQPYKNFAEAEINLNTPAKIDDFQKKHFEWAFASQGGGCAGVDIGLNFSRMST